MKSLHRHPNSILFQILLIQFGVSLKYLVTGTAFKVNGNDLKYTPSELMDFGFLEYGCKIEGLIAYLLFFMIILWNFVFTYDVYLTVNKPLIFNENYVFYYKAFVYFTGTMFSIVVFFPNMSIFTGSSIYICYIQTGLIYNCFVNLPIVAYFVINLYVSMKYTRESRYKGYTKNKHRIDQILSIHRWYFAFWTIFQFSNLIFGLVPSNSPKLVTGHSIFMSLTPWNICIAFFKAIYYTRTDNAYQLIDLEDTENKEQGGNQSLLDSMIMSHPPPGLETKMRHQRNPSGNAATMEQVKKHWNKGENFKDVLRREVLEYIVKGFEKIFKSKDEIASRTIEQLEIEDLNLKPEKTPLFRRLILFCLGKEDPNHENYEDEGNRSFILGHPDVLKKVSPLSQTQIDKETQNEKSVFVKRNLTLNSKSKPNQEVKDDEYEFIELAPTLFKNIRRMHNIDDPMVRSIFNTSNIKELDITISSGKGGSFFIKPIHGGRMLIKSITKPEYELIQNFLSDYYCYLLMNPNTYLNPIIGVYKLKLQKSSQVPPITFILMRNVLNIDPEDLKPHDKVYCFDLKGSVHGRRTLENPSEILNYEENYHFHKDLILKDIDFFQSFRKLDITTIQAERIMSQISEDAKFLADHNFMDYSLLLYIVIKPYQEVKSHLALNMDYNSEVNRFKSIDMQSAKPKDPNEKPRVFATDRNTLSVMPSNKDMKRLERAIKNAPPQAEDDSKAVHTTVRKLSDVLDLEQLRIDQQLQEHSRENRRNTLFISEGLAKPKTGRLAKNTNIPNEKPVLVLKEKKNKKLRIYHICNVNDISTMKAIDQEEKRRVTMINYQQHKFNSIAEGNSDEDQDNRVDYSKDSENFDDIFNRSQHMQNNDYNMYPSRPSAAFFGRESMVSSSGGALGAGRSSILNFKSASKQKLREKPSDYQITTSGEHNDQESYREALERKMREIDRRLEKECHNCKAGCKENHIIELSDCMEESDEDKDESMDEPWKNISDTDVIEQVIFDPQLGMIKREIHFGIIDYITTFTLMKKIEEKIKGVIQDDPSAVRPHVYAQRFTDCAKSAFE